VWSQINRDHIARLTVAGRMTPGGQRQVDAAKRTAAGTRPTPPSAAPPKPPFPTTCVPPSRPTRGAKTFRTLGRLNLFALAFRTNNMKTPAGRARKIEALVAMLARGETIVPERRR
jgi:uncharacterized protein YdeI (YjbR/CyaY-like superfamily)